jgi:hypothetical protein
MKNIFRFACAAILAASLAGSIAAQKQPSKDEWFQQIAKLTNTKKEADLASAYEQSKAFLAKFGKDTDDKVKKIRDFAAKYRLNAFQSAVADVRMADALEFGEEILADEPENAGILMTLAYGGFQAFTQKKDKGYGARSIDFARRSLALYEAGKLPKDFNPFADQAEATAWMHYIIGVFTLEYDLKDAATNFVRAIAQRSQIKDDTYPYLVVANYYERQYEAQAADFEKNHAAKRTADDASKAARAVIDETLDRMVDAYARAVKLSEAKPDAASKGWRDRLEQVYKFRKGDTKGLPELIAAVFATPMKEPN